MADKPKNLEELAKQVIDTQMGLSSKEDLEAYFDALGIGPTQQQPEIPAAEPASAPQSAPAAPTPSAPAQAPTPEPAKTESQQEKPVDMSFLPEKFRDKNIVESAKKIAKSYAELESELKKQKDELGNMKKLVDSLTQRPAETPMPGDVSLDDIDDSLFFEKPKEVISNVAKRIAAQTIMQYHAGMERAKYVENFKAAHPDFELLKDEILTILQTRPDLDRDPANLPLVYNMAKESRAKKIAALKAQLGLQQQTQPQSQAPQIDVNKIREEVARDVTADAIEKAVAKVLEDIRKRKGASGIQGGTTPMSPDQRVQSQTEVPKTYDEIVLEEMLQSGPKKLQLGE